jgi:hypothetical protein
VLFGRGLRLLRDADSGHAVMCAGSVALFEWAEHDRATRRLVVAQVVNAKLATRVEVARVFGLHVNTVSRIAQQVASPPACATSAVRVVPSKSRQRWLRSCDVPWMTD